MLWADAWPVRRGSKPAVCTSESARDYASAAKALRTDVLATKALPIKPTSKESSKRNQQRASGAAAVDSGAADHAARTAMSYAESPLHRRQPAI